MGCYLLPTKCSFQLLDCSVIGNSLRAILSVKCLQEGNAAGVSMVEKLGKKRSPVLSLRYRYISNFHFITWWNA